MRRFFNVRHRLLALPSLLCALLVGTLAAQPVGATPALTMDVATGEVLYQQDATQPWFPASTTKLLTVYVALSAVRDHQITMDTPLVVSQRALRMPPSKMGFAVGTQVTLDNALKILMVRSANDVAITVAEGIAGSVEAFADDMNRASEKLGMRESHWVNPNGLPDPDHYSSVRDMGILARALYTEFPDQASLFNLGALSFGREIIGNHNNLLGRYPGVDGMKTGFTCPAGFNVVASAFRDGRRLVVVVFGAPTVAARSQKVAALFDRGFAGVDRPQGAALALPASTVGGPPDMRNQVCRNRGPLLAEFNAEVTALDAPLMVPRAAGLGLPALNPERAFLFSPTATPAQPTALRISSMPAPVFDPVPVHIGAEPGYTGPVAQARAPHSAVGSEPEPVTASAYAATPAAAAPAQIGGTPLSVDANALPMQGRKVRTAHRGRHGRPAMKAAAEAPTTKVMAGADDAKTSAKPAAKAIGDADEGNAKKGRKGGKLAAKPAPNSGKTSAAAKKPAKAAAKHSGSKVAAKDAKKSAE